MENLKFPSKQRRVELREEGIFAFSYFINCSLSIILLIIFIYSIQNKIGKDFETLFTAGNFESSLNILLETLKDIVNYLIIFIILNIFLRIFVTLIQSRFYFKIRLYKNHVKKIDSFITFILRSTLIIASFLSFFLIIKSRIPKILNTFGYYKEFALKSSKNNSEVVILSNLNSLQFDLTAFTNEFLFILSLGAVFCLFRSLLYSKVSFLINNREPKVTGEES